MDDFLLVYVYLSDFSETSALTHISPPFLNRYCPEDGSAYQGWNRQRREKRCSERGCEKSSPKDAGYPCERFCANYC